MILTELQKVEIKNYYSQIDEDMSGDIIGQEASLKTAKTSYFKIMQ